MRLETKLDQLLPDWPSFNVQFHELWREPDGPLCGGWSVNDSWTPFAKATKEETIGHLRARWEVFKLNYLPKARVMDLEDIGCDEDSPCMLEVDCVAFATLTKGE